MLERDLSTTMPLSSPTGTHPIHQHLPLNARVYQLVKPFLNGATTGREKFLLFILEILSRDTQLIFKP